MKEEHIIKLEDTEENNTNIKEQIIEKLKQNIKLIIKIIIVSIIMLIAIIFYLYTLLQNQKNSVIVENTIYEDSNNIIESNKLEETKIIIHITGEVKKPGVYELSEFSRISDAIEIAEGITSDADLTNVNLAYQLSDGQKIKIPCINNENNGNYIIENSGEKIIEDSKYSESKDTKININTANISELTSLPGIGEATAKKIITYREENGKFKEIQEIKNVSGIGESKYNQIKDYIKVK